MTGMAIAWSVGGTILAGCLGLTVTRVVAWRRANRPPVRLTIESGLTDADERRNADYPIYRELYHKAGYAAGNQRAVLAAAHNAGLLNERYEASTGAGTAVEVEERDYPAPAAADCVAVLRPDFDGPVYEGLDRDSEADADEWIQALERAGHSVTRGQVALDQAYARLINEEFTAFDRATTEAYNRVAAAGSDTIIEWANDWKQYKEEHGLEVATVEIQGIREWIDNELAGNVAASIVAELPDGALDTEAAKLAETPH